MQEFNVVTLMKQTMKAKEQTKLEVIRSVKAKMLLLQTSGKITGELNQEQIQDCIRKEIKERKEHLESVIKKLTTLTENSAEFFTFSSQKEEDEKSIEFLNQYLPQLMSLDEMQTIVDSLMQEGKKMPDVMKYFSTHFKGKADMKTVSQLVKEKLNKN